MKNLSRIALLAIIAIVCALSVTGCASLPKGGAGDGESVWVIHYFRPDANYSGWDLWLWPAQPNDNGAGYTFGSPDADGFVSTTAYLPEDISEIGIIVRKGGDEWTDKDIADDRFATAKEVWLVSGDPEVHEQKPAVR
jgi:pullulanase